MPKCGIENGALNRRKKRIWFELCEGFYDPEFSKHESFANRFFESADPRFASIVSTETSISLHSLICYHSWKRSHAASLSRAHLQTSSLSSISPSQARLWRPILMVEKSDGFLVPKFGAQSSIFTSNHGAPDQQPGAPEQQPRAPEQQPGAPEQQPETL